MIDLSDNPEAPVLVIGAASVDVVGRLNQTLEPGTSNPAQIRSSFGGVARNVSENLARLGQPVTLLTTVGQDQVGEQILRYASSCGVDVSHVIQSENHPTGTYAAVVNQTGQLQFALDDMRAVSEITSPVIRSKTKLFKEAAIVFIDANLPPKTIRTIFSQARKAKCLVCADPTSTSLAPRLKPYLDRIDILISNNREAAALSGMEVHLDHQQESQAAARQMVTLGADFAIVTLAEFGLAYATSDHSGRVPALRTEILDPTGGGDALISAVLFALLNGIQPDEAVRLGIAAASLTLQHQGAVLPDLSLEKLYNHLVI